MPMIRVTVDKLSFENGKIDWTIKSDEIIMLNGGQQFIKLTQAKTSGFTRLVFDHNDADVEQLPLAASRGYLKLQELRNEMQSEELVSKKTAVIPAMFRAAAPKGSRRVSVKDARMMKATSDTVCVDIPAFLMHDKLRIDVQRPLIGANALVVRYDPDIIEHIIEFIRYSGFDSDLMRKNPSSGLPKGVYAKRGVHGDRTYEYTIEIGGMKRRRRAPTIIDAAEAMHSGVVYTSPTKSERETDPMIDYAVGTDDGDDGVGGGGSDDDEGADGGESDGSDSADGCGSDGTASDDADVS